MCNYIYIYISLSLSRYLYTVQLQHPPKFTPKNGGLEHFDYFSIQLGTIIQ